MRSLASVSLRTLLRTRRRYLLTAIGASLGVAVLFAVLVVAGASRDALDRAIHGQTGRADVIISPTGSFDAVVPFSTAGAVRSLPGVDQVITTIGMRSALHRRDGERSSNPRDDIIFVTGIGSHYGDLHELRRLEGRAPTVGAPEIDVPQALADRQELHVGDETAVATPSGSTRMIVTGILADTGAATANQGAVAFTSAATVRAMLGTPGAVNGVQVDLASGVDSTAWIERHRDQFSGLSFQRSSDLAAGYASFIEGVNTALTLVSAIALFVGGFLIYLTFSVAVAERTSTLATIRALGAGRARVRRMVVVEAALLGGFCSLIGLGVGYALAMVAIGIVGGLFELDLGTVGTPVGVAAFCLAVGVGIGAVAAWWPARRASRIDPVSAMRAGALAIEHQHLRWVGPVLLTTGLAIGLTASSMAISALGLLLLLAGAVLSVHLAIAPIARMMGAVFGRLAPGTGTIAVRHLERERQRSSYTLALVMVAFAALVAIGASNAAMADSLDAILDSQASAIQVGAPGALDGEVADELAAVQGTGIISPVRFGNADLTATRRDGNGRVLGTNRTSSPLQVIDPDTYFEVSGLPYAEGDEEHVRAALSAGGAVVLPSREMSALDLHVGDVVQVATVTGAAPFRVAGSYAVMGGGFGTVASVVDLDRLGAGRVNGYLVGTDGTDPEVVADRIRAEVGDRHQLIVDSPGDTRAYATGQLSGFFSLGYAILAVTGAISLLGLANTLVVAVLSRTREIGVLRSYGARRRQLRRMVTLEALLMCGIAIVLALPLAALMAQALIDGQIAALGSDLSFRYPWPLIPPLAVGALVVASLAAMAPARRAAGLEIVDTLRAD